MTGTEENKDLDELKKDLSCDIVTKCQAARRELVKMGSRAVPTLIEALNSKNTWVRWESVKALGQIADPAATGILIRLLENNEFDMRWMAAEWLIAIGRNAVVPLLETLMERPNSIWLREGAHHVFHDMRRGDLDEILQPVMDALGSVEAFVEVPVKAENALDKIKSGIKTNRDQPTLNIG